MSHSSVPLKEIVVSGQMKDFYGEQSITTRGGTILLTTGGRPLPMVVRKGKFKPPPKFPNSSLDQLQLKMGCSDTSMRKLDNFLRIHCGWDSIQDHQLYMVACNNWLREKFEFEKIAQTEYYSKEVELPSGKKKKKIMSR